MHLMRDQLHQSVTVILTMLLPCLSRGQSKSQEKAVDKQFVPITKCWEPYFMAAILPNGHCELGGFLNNAIG